METYQQYIEMISGRRPHLRRFIHILICAITTLIFKGRKICITIWLVGPSSGGKGEIFRLISQLPVSERELYKSLFHRTDRFTENSFISNRADVRDEESRKKLDLIRKLPDKVLATAELGSFLSGHKDKLQEKFGVLTRVLDGEGLSTDTGAHGTRSVDENIEFIWLGATTELDPRKHEVLSQIGGRVMTLDLDCAEVDEVALIDSIIEGFPEEAESEISRLLALFYNDLFSRFPKSSVPISSITIDRSVGSMIFGLAQVGSSLRSFIPSSEEKHAADENQRVQVEQPYRFARNLQLLGRASAVLRGDTKVNFQDVHSVLTPLVLSSGPSARHKVFKFLLQSTHALDAQKIVKGIRLSKTTVGKALKELSQLELVNVTETSANNFIPVYSAKSHFMELFRSIEECSNDSAFASPPVSKSPLLPTDANFKIRGETMNPFSNGQFQFVDLPIDKELL